MKLLTVDGRFPLDNPSRLESIPADLDEVVRDINQPRDGHMCGTLLKRLVIPPEYAEAVEAVRKRWGIRSKRQELEFERSILLRIHYGGKDVACVNSADGIVVLAAGLPGSEEYSKDLGRLSADQYDQFYVVSPEPWDIGAGTGVASPHKVGR